MSQNTKLALEKLGEIIDSLRDLCGDEEGRQEVYLDRLTEVYNMFALEERQASKNSKIVIKFLLVNEYRREFEIIDGLNQHPDGLNFEEWLTKNGLN